MLKINNLFFNSYLFKTLKKLKNNFHLYSCTIVLDLIFLAVVLLMGKYLSLLLPLEPEELYPVMSSPTKLIFLIFVYPVVYYLFLIFIYSIMKLIVLGIIKKSFERSKLKLRRIFRFYLLNLSIFIIFSFVGIVSLVLIKILFENVFYRYILTLLSIVYLFFFYSTIQISNIIFIKFDKTKLRRLLRDSFFIVFKKIMKYGTYLCWDIVGIFLYLLFYNIVHVIFRAFVFSNKELIIRYAPSYLRVFNIVSLVFVYFMLAFNRFYLYAIIDKNVLPQHKSNNS